MCDFVLAIPFKRSFTILESYSCKAFSQLLLNRAKLCPLSQQPGSSNAVLKKNFQLCLRLQPKGAVVFGFTAKWFCFKWAEETHFLLLPSLFVELKSSLPPNPSLAKVRCKMCYIKRGWFTYLRGCTWAWIPRWMSDNLQRGRTRWVRRQLTWKWILLRGAVCDNRGQDVTWFLLRGRFLGCDPLLQLLPESWARLWLKQYQRSKAQGGQGRAFSFTTSVHKHANEGAKCQKVHLTGFVENFGGLLLNTLPAAL